MVVAEEPKVRAVPIDRLIKQLERCIDRVREATGKPPKYNKKRPLRGARP